jgi:hypothetical protein
MRGQEVSVPSRRNVEGADRKTVRQFAARADHGSAADLGRNGVHFTVASGIVAPADAAVAAVVSAVSLKTIEGANDQFPSYLERSSLVPTSRNTCPPGA